MVVAIAHWGNGSFNLYNKGTIPYLILTNASEMLIPPFIAKERTPYSHDPFFADGVAMLHLEKVANASLAAMQGNLQWTF